MQTFLGGKTIISYFFVQIFSDCINCPVAMYQLYKSKLNPKINNLWQRPKKGNVNFTDECWFDAVKLGHNPLETFMNLQSKEYTNHSIRVTCISKLDMCGFEARHITAISSHKSESTICEWLHLLAEFHTKKVVNWTNNLS